MSMLKVRRYKKCNNGMRRHANNTSNYTIDWIFYNLRFICDTFTA